MKKKLKNINKIIIVILILLTTILIGTPINESNVQIVYIASSIFTVYYFLNKIIKKEKIITNKIDIYFALLIISTLIPLIFKKYVSLSDTIHNILKYFCAYSIYLIVKSECREDKKFVDLLINIIIITIVLLCLVGFDEITFKCLTEFKKNIGYDFINYDEKRICSLFSYPNTMAAISGFGIFLAIGNFLESKKLKYKILYIISSIIMLITLILTYSRLVYIIFSIIFVLYLAIIFRKNGINKKINKRNIIIISFIIFGIILYTIIGLNISKKFKVNKEYQKILYTIEPNEEYTFEFDITSKGNNSIRITEKNEYFDDIKVTEEKIEDFYGVKEINIKTDKNTSVIYININSEENSELFINKSYLNNEELILKYRLLPTNVIEKIQSISLKNKSSWERIAFITDALKLIKENWIFGLGGGAWKTTQLKVQQYNYYANQVHCFPIQLFLENGIICFLSYISIAVWLIKCLVKKIKEKDLKLISIIIGIIFIQLHSLVDFNMSFFYVLLIVFASISVISSKENNTKIKANLLICIIIIIISLVNIYVSTIENYYKNNTDILKVNDVWTEEKIFATYNELIPFNEKVKNKNYKVLSKSKEDNCLEIKKILRSIIKDEKYINSNISLEYLYSYMEACMNCKELFDNDIEFVLQYVYDTEKFSKYDPYFQIERFKNIEKIANILKTNEKIEYANKFTLQLKKEIAEKEQYILDNKKTRYSEKENEKVKVEIKQLK